MSKVKFGSGLVWKLLKKGVRRPIETLQEALAEEAKCSACGCDETQGFFTMKDLVTESVHLVFLYDNVLLHVDDTAANRSLFAECCSERSAGTLDGTACQALETAGVAVV
jgi:hypothetical protein